MDLWWIAPSMVVLMVLKAFFSGSEIALVSADKVHLRHRASKGDRGAAKVLEMERSPELLLATTLVGTNLSIVALTTLGTVLMIRLLGGQGELVAILAFSPLFLILTEVVPKSVFQQNANRIAPVVIWPLRAIMVVMFPVVYGFALIARLATRLVGGKGMRHVFMSREMVRAVLDAAEKTADVSTLTLDRLKRAVQLSEITVGEVMIPMGEVSAVGRGESARRAVELALAKGHFRLPVYEDEASAVVGVVALDAWKLMTPGLAEQPLRELVTAAEYVAPQQPVYELLPLLRKRDDRMAIVVDEFGSAVGMITLEDVQETVLGEFVGAGYHIPGYVHRPKRSFRALADDVYVVDARLPISEVNELLATRLPTNEAHTVGGFLTASLRHLPKEGESVVAAGRRFTVEEASGRFVRTVRIEPA